MFLIILNNFFFFRIEEINNEKNIVSATVVKDLGIIYEIKLSNDDYNFYILKDSEKIGVYKKFRENEKKKNIFYR